ncbi:MAG: tRNA (5-methylaminomethyl-2-thiouridine)(34)-methyltransferase MnmD, partial [Albidovulum sp.]
DMARALDAFPELSDITEPLLSAWRKGQRRFDLGPVAVEIIDGDARRTLPVWRGKADAWYLDGFSPAKNPELWQEPLMAEVARHTRPNGTFATYSAAGYVRRGLRSAGFQVERVPGYGHKRHMSRGILDPLA